MQMVEYYSRLDDTVRTLVATAYVEVMRQLKINNHPALSSANGRIETSVLVCWRMVSRCTLGVRNADELKAYAVAGIGYVYRLGVASSFPAFAPRILREHLRAARSDFEMKLLRFKQAGGRLGAPSDFGSSAVKPVLKQRFDDLSLAKAHYFHLLRLWSEGGNAF